MRSVLRQVLVWAVTTVVVGFLAGGEWPHFLIGAILGLALWVMLFAGSFARRPSGRVRWLDYANAAGVAVVLGFVMQLIGDGPVWWSVGFIVAGMLVPATRSAQHDERAAGHR